ncbi:MAG TPA: endolytic transglycosylase MltG [Patescibacteria group bacterium]|nr:endolytic transglycosylase MltG [Patescibacteria group bacterium]
MRSLLAFCVAFAASFFIIWYYAGPVDTNGKETIFVVPQQTDNFDVPQELKNIRLVRSAQVFRWLLGGKSVVPGGYRLRPSMSAWAIVEALTNAPQFVWVTVREGLRKEQIGELLGTKLGWTSEQEAQWNALGDEGQFFPDTYLLPVDEPVSTVAQRFHDRFNEKFAPFIDQFTAKNIIWTTGIKIASLIERESGGDSDKRLIAGIIWNRLEKDMKLEIDATLQYIKGNSETGWWSRVVSEDKFLNSPYNTYRNKGLPPGPISNPGLASIDAVLHPEETDCIFYLHSSDRQIHCSVTYAEHVENIRTYLQ